MACRFTTIAVGIAGFLLLSGPAAATTMATCNGTVSCTITENILLLLPFAAIAGDVILTDSGSVVSDIFHIENNLVNTGGGTGLGNLVFLFSADDTVLPSPATYSANAVFMPEDPSGITSYSRNGTTYLLGTPEPRTFGLLSLAIAVVLIARRRSPAGHGGL